MHKHAMLVLIVGVLAWTTSACRGGAHPEGVAPAPTSMPPPAKTQEHPGAEHPGSEQEQPGGKATDDKQSHRFTAPEIKAAMHQYVTSETTKGGGVFAMRDPVAEKALSLTFVKLHDPVREVAGRGYFACADFQAIDDGTMYDVDVWLIPNGDRLQPTETVVHKVAGRPRFTYQNNQAVPVP